MTNNKHTQQIEKDDPLDGFELVDLPTKQRPSGIEQTKKTLLQRIEDNLAVINKVHNAKPIKRPMAMQNTDGTWTIRLKLGSISLVSDKNGRPKGIAAGKSEQDAAAILVKIAERIQSGRFDAKIEEARTQFQNRTRAGGGNKPSLAQKQTAKGQN